MELVLQIDELKKAVDNVNKFTPSKPLIANDGIIFTCTKDKVVLTAMDNTSTLLAYNLFNCTIKDLTEDEVNFSVPSIIFADTIKKLKDNVVLTITDNATVQLKSGTFKFKLPQIAVNNSILENTKSEVKKTIELDTTTLLKAIKKASVCVATDGARPALKGVYFDISTDVLKVVSCDGYKLFLGTIQLGQDSGVFSLLLQAQALAQLTTLPIETETITLGVTENNNALVVNTNLFTFKSVLLGEKYIDYNRIIGSSNSNIFKTDTKELYNIIDTISSASSYGNIGWVRLAINEDSTMEVGVKTEKIDANSQLLIETDEVKPIELFVNNKYISSILKTITDEETTISVNQPNTPIYINGDDFMFMVLPMRNPYAN